MQRYLDYFVPLVKRWIAGVNMHDLIQVSKIANNKGMGVILNYLGEEIKDEKLISETLKEYERLIFQIIKNKLKASISLKLTQLGLSYSEKICEKNLMEIIEKAKKYNITVWIDMEDSRYTLKTINLYLKSLNLYENVGVAIQTYLKKSSEYVNLLIKKNGMIRLVKGAYNEPSEIVYKTKKEIAKNYYNLLLKLFETKSKFVIATHDEKLVYEGVKLSLKTKHFPPFAFLRGVRNDLKKWLLKNKFYVEEYIPYGKQWLKYVYRRIRERKSNIMLILTSLFTK